MILKDGRVVKGNQFKDCRYIINPRTATKINIAKSSVELLFLDNEASKKGRKVLNDVIEKASVEKCIHFCVKGRLYSTEIFSKFFLVGANKVSIFIAADEIPDLTKKRCVHFRQSVHCNFHQL